MTWLAQLLQDTERLRLRYTEEERAEIQDYASQ